MGERHVEELFSAAYDGALSDGERRRYDAHLAGCARCTAAEEEFRAAVDAVRALPAASMPVRVVLPATPPVAERRRLLPRLRLPQLSPVWGAGAMAAVGIAAVVVAVHAHGGQSAAGGSAAVLGQAHPELRQGITGGSGTGAAAGAPHSAAVLCPQPKVLNLASADTLSVVVQPQGFSNRVAITNPQRPGEELVLATTSSRYPAGAQVLVFAALTTSTADHTAVVPCVELHGPVLAGGGNLAPAPTASASAGGGESGRVAGSDLYAQDFSPLAIAVPTAQSIAGRVPVQVLTIPAGVPRGTVLQLIATIPAGVPGSSDKPAVEAVLTVVVS